MKLDMMADEVVEMKIHAFLTSALHGVEEADSRSGRSVPVKDSPLPQYFLDRRLGGPQNVRTRWRRGNFFFSL
jgi:hypothetical protein